LLSVFPLFTAHLEDQSEDQSYTLALIHLHTGLSHQIRAQLSYHGWPLAADTKYGGKQTREFPFYFLHAFCIAMQQPLFSDMPVSLIDPVPLDFSQTIERVFNRSKAYVESLILETIQKMIEGQ